jgi:hypothetical protein
MERRMKIKSMSVRPVLTLQIPHPFYVRLETPFLINKKPWPFLWID